MKVTTYNVPAAGGAFLTIPATQPNRRTEIVEDDSVTDQGLIWKDYRDKFTAVHEMAATREPIVLGTVGNFAGRGSLYAHPIQKDVSGTITIRPADTLVQITSATGTATKIRVTEYD
jgi:hypothetical protein